MHLFTASLGTETNTFSPIPTGAQLFADTSLVRGGAYPANPDLFSLPMLEFRDRGRARGWRVTESLCAFAVPAGTTVQRVYEAFRDEILADLATGDGRTRHEIGFLRLGRPALGGADLTAAAE